MDSAASLKPKVTVKLNYDKPNGTPPARAYGLSVHSRPPSPAKSYVSSTPQSFNVKNMENDGGNVFKPKAKVNSSATARRPATAGSTVGSTRPSSPTKSSRARAHVSSTSSRGSSSVTIAGTRTPRANPPVSAPVTPQIHARSLHLPNGNDDTSATHLVSPLSLHHATSVSSFPVTRATSVVGGSSTVSSSAASHRLFASRSVVGFTEPAHRDRSLASSPTLKIRSKVTAISKANADSVNATASSSSNPTSPVHATIRSTTPNPTVNVRSRRPSSASLAPSSPPPHMNSTSPAPAEPKAHVNGGLRARAPSSVSGPTGPPPQFYPITTAVSAANPHRFASARPPAVHTPPHSPPAASGSATSSRANSTLGVQPLFQSFSSMPSARVANTNRPNGKTLSANIDPTTIPLPPHSPPASSLSFSSRSSVSHLDSRPGGTSKYGHSRTGSSSTSGGSRNGPMAPKDMRATLDNLMQYTSETTSEDEGSGLEDEAQGEGRTEELKVKAAAKSDRKMADLEITNRSLMAINASLEATKHRQAKEIQDLRRRLREARLILPPRAFLASKDSTLSTFSDADLGLDNDSSSSEDEGNDEDEGEKPKDPDARSKVSGDAAFRRIKLLLDTLLKEGTAALEHEKDMVGLHGGAVAKVLSPEEVRVYHAGGEHPDDGDKEDASHDDRSVSDYPRSDNDEQTESEADLTHEADTSLDTVDGGYMDPNMSTASEDEVEAILGSPPILITKPS